MTKFDWDSWSRTALAYAETAEAVATTIDKVTPLGDVNAAGSASNVSTLIDDAIAAIFPASVGAVTDILGEVATQVANDAGGLYATAQLYHDVEADNTLSTQQIDAALGETPFNP